MLAIGTNHKIPIFRGMWYAGSRHHRNEGCGRETAKSGRRRAVLADGDRGRLERSENHPLAHPIRPEARNARRSAGLIHVRRLCESQGRGLKPFRGFRRGCRRGGLPPIFREWFFPKGGRDDSARPEPVGSGPLRGRPLRSRCSRDPTVAVAAAVWEPVLPSRCR